MIRARGTNERCKSQWRRSASIARFAALLICVSTSLVAHAQSQRSSAGATLESAEYKDLIHKALQEFELSHWAEAKVYFTKAHALAPSARTLRGLAMVCYESRQYVEAIDYASRALESRVQPVTEQMRTALQAQLNQSRSFVSHVKVHSEPPSAALNVDGVVANLAADGVLQLDPGEHELIATAPGYQTLTRQLTVQGGKEMQVDLVLTAEPVVAAAPAALPVEPLRTAPRAASESNSQMLPWIVIGASAAVAIAGAVALGIAVSDKNKVENSQYPTTWSQVRGAYDSAPTLFGVGFALIGVGVAGAAAGLTWKFWPAHAGVHDSSASLHVAPTGLRLCGAF